MATYNIYSYNNGEDRGEPSVVVELNDDDTEIVSVTSRDPEQQEEDEKSIRYYVELGATPLAALQRYAGSYGQVWNADGSGEVSEDSSSEAVAEDSEAVAEDVDTSDEAVVSAAEDVPEEDAPDEDVPEEDTAEDVAQEGPSADDVPEAAGRITSGATMALVSDAGVVVTLFQADEEGNLNYRMNGEWKPLVDPDTISDLNFVGVEEEALNLYDEHQGNGNLVPIQYYPSSVDGPYWTDIVVTDEEAEEVADAPEAEAEETAEAEEEEVDEEAVTAALTLDGPRDLDNAISAALLNKDLRWFVERRVAALGLEAQLPWQNG